MAAVNPILSIGIQNKNVLNETSSAYKAALKLAEDGYTVLGITIGQGLPVITIVTEDICKHLNGVETVKSRNNKNSFMISRTLYGCLVQWSRAG